MECFIDASDPVRSTQIRAGRIGRDSQAKRRSYKYYQMFMMAQKREGNEPASAKFDLFAF